EQLRSRVLDRIMHEASLHDGNSGTVSSAILDLERASRRLTLGKYRVAMPHQHDGAVRRPANGRAQRVAEFLVFDGLAGYLLLLQEFAQPRANRVHAGLVVRPAVDVHDLFEQRQHRTPLAAEPFDHSPLALPARRHEQLLNAVCWSVFVDTYDGNFMLWRAQSAFIPPRMH